MSSTNRGAERRADDAYATPPWVVHRLLDDCALFREWLPRNHGDDVRWLEPACGDGAIIKAVAAWLGAKQGPRWFANDIRQDAIDAVLASTHPSVKTRCGDFLPDGWPGAGRVDAVLMNPPFALAEEFVRVALARTLGPVGVLLRLGWLSSAGRAPLLRDQPPDVFVLPDRPSFTGHGTDSADYAWFCWPPADEPRTRERGSIRVLALTPKAERLARSRRPNPSQEL